MPSIYRYDNELPLASAMADWRRDRTDLGPQITGLARCIDTLHLARIA